MRPPYWMIAMLGTAFMLLGISVSACLPWLLHFQVISYYGDQYAFAMYLFAITLPVTISSGCILLWEAIVRIFDWLEEEPKNHEPA